MAKTKSVQRVERALAKEEEKKTAAAIHKLKNDLVNNHNIQNVMDKILSAALDDEHKHQAAAWKLVVDRVMPQSVFEQEVTKGQARSAIQINISTMGQSTSTDIIEGEVTDD